jgi:hypothetical protein
MRFPKATYTPPFTAYDGLDKPATATVPAEAWEALRQYNIKLENYLCQCIVLLAQHNLLPPNAPESVEEMLRDKFINAIKGE